MTTEIIYPISPIITGPPAGVQRQPGGGTNYWEAVDDVRGSYDDATDYIYFFNAGAAMHCYPQLGTLVGAVGALNWMNLESRGRLEAGAVNMVVAFRQDSYSGCETSLKNTHTGTSWNTLLTSNLTTNTCNGGAAWLAADASAANTKMIARSAASTGGHWNGWSGGSVQIDYTPPSGGYIWLLNTWLPPLLAVASHAVTYAEMLGFYGVKRDSRKLRSKSIQKFRVFPSDQDGPSHEEEFSLIKAAMAVRPRYVFTGW